MGTEEQTTDFGKNVFSPAQAAKLLETVSKKYADMSTEPVFVPFGTDGYLDGVVVPARWLAGVLASLPADDVRKELDCLSAYNRPADRSQMVAYNSVDEAFDDIVG